MIVYTPSRHYHPCVVRGVRRRPGKLAGTCTGKPSKVAVGYVHTTLGTTQTRQYQPRPDTVPHRIRTDTDMHTYKHREQQGTSMNAYSCQRATHSSTDTQMTDECAVCFNDGRDTRPTPCCGTRTSTARLCGPCMDSMVGLWAAAPFATKGLIHGM